MRRSNRSTDLRARLTTALADDRGSASLEFLVGGLLLLVPIVYLVVALGAIQSASLGVEAAARHTARAVGLATDAEQAAARADLVLTDVASEYGIPRDGLALDLRCADTTGACPAAGATVTVTVYAAIPLPLVPPVLGLDDLTSVPVEATAVHKTSRLWGSAP